MKRASIFVGTAARHLGISVVAIALPLLLAGTGLQAQFPPWFRVVWNSVGGPEGGQVAAFAVDVSAPDFVSAAMRDGTLWLSRDAGRTWEFAASLAYADRGEGVVSGPEVTALDANVFLAATGSNIEWCCLHGGIWATKGHVSGGGVVRQLAVSGTTAATIARVDPPPNSGGGPRLERSTDTGATWSAAPLPDGAQPLQIAADSRFASRLYARTDRGVYRSTDFFTWTKANAGMPLALSALAIAPSTPSTLYAVDGANQLHRTTDGADHWQQRGAPIFPANPIAPIEIGQLVIDAADPALLYLTALHHAGRRTFHSLHRSRDGGLTWVELETATGAASGLLVSVPSSPAPKLLAAIPAGGVLVSENDGETFTVASGLHAATIETLAASTRPPSILYTGALPVTIAASSDRGATWTQRLTFGLGPSTVRVRDVAADPRDPTVAWAVDDLMVYRIADAGKTIEGITSPFGLGASRIAVGNSTPRTLYVVGNAQCPLQKSVDSGATWSCPGSSPLLEPTSRALVVDPNDPAIVHRVDGDGRLLRSDDGAESWAPAPLDHEVTAFAVDPLDGAILYAATVSNGLWKSLDGGASWSLLSDFGSPATALFAHPVDSDRLYVTFASGTRRGVFATVDGGSSFNPVGVGRGETVPSYLGLPREIVSGPLEIDPELPTRLYAGTRGAGVWTAVHEEPAPCREDARTLCLNGGRFRVQARWRDFKDRVGPAHAVRLTADSGYFWFFEPANLELMVKALDARTLNQRFWIFYGALSNVEFQLLVTDTETGQVNAYFNPERQFASRGDTAAFPREPQNAVRAIDAHAETLATFPSSTRSRAAGATATADEALLLKGGRFRVTVEWRDFQGRPGIGHARSLNDTTGTFWFFDEDNLEIAIKILDGRALNDHYWVFYGALSNVEYRIQVEDTSTGEVRTYSNPSGQFASRGDTAAFRSP